MPAELCGNAVPVLPVLGAHMRSPGDAEAAPSVLGEEGGALAHATARFLKFWDNLKPFIGKGIKRQGGGALLRAYAGPASQHALQLAPAPDDAVLSYDGALRLAWETLAERPLDADS